MRLPTAVARKKRMPEFIVPPAAYAAVSNGGGGGGGGAGGGLGGGGAAAPHPGRPVPSSAPGSGERGRDRGTVELHIPTFVLGASVTPPGAGSPAGESGGAADGRAGAGGERPILPLLLDGPVRPASPDRRRSCTLPGGPSPHHLRQPSNPEVVTAEGVPFCFRHE